MKISIKLAAAFMAPGLAVSPLTCAVATPASLPSDDTEALALGHELVAIAFPPERRQEMMDKIMGSMLQQMKAGMPIDKITDPQLKTMLLDYVDNVPTMLRPVTTAFIPKQMNAIAQAYAHMFTPAQLRDIVAFAHTPSGKDYLQRATDVLSDPAVAAVNTDYFRQTQQISQAGAVELSQKVTAYIKAHPEAAPKP
jgi:hypothetical protein